MVCRNGHSSLPGLLSFPGKESGRSGAGLAGSFLISGVRAPLICHLGLLTSRLLHVLRCLLEASSLIVQIVHARKGDGIEKPNTHSQLFITLEEAFSEVIDSILVIFTGQN